MADVRNPLRALSKAFADPRIRMAAATASVHAAWLAKKQLKRLWKKRRRSQSLRRALDSVVDRLQETATNWLIGPSPDAILHEGTTRKGARRKKRPARAADEPASKRTARRTARPDRLRAV
jgi:hypothetical protein